MACWEAAGEQASVDTSLSFFVFVLRSVPQATLACGVTTFWLRRLLVATVCFGQRPRQAGGRHWWGGLWA